MIDSCQEEGDCVSKDRVCGGKEGCMKRWFKISCVLAISAVAATMFACVSDAPKETEAVVIIGGADGPTSVFVAGKLGGKRKTAETRRKRGVRRKPFLLPGNGQPRSPAVMQTVYLKCFLLSFRKTRKSWAFLQRRTAAGRWAGRAPSGREPSSLWCLWR